MIIPAITEQASPANNTTVIRTMFPFLGPYKWIVAALIMLHLLPLWLFTYFPSQDGPSHLYNAFILNKFFDTSFPFQDFFSLRLTLFPNWLSHAVLATLMMWLSPLLAEKIMLSMYVVCFPLAVFYFLHAIRPGRHPLALISFVFIYNYLLFMGFYNFVFSVPLCLFTLGYWWKHCYKLSLLRIMAIFSLCTVLFFCHLMTYAITVGIMFLIILTFRGKGANFVRFAACMSPSLILLFLYVQNSAIGSGAESIIEAVLHPPAGQIEVMIRELVSMSAVKNYDGTQAAVARLVGLVLLTCLALSLIGRTCRREKSATFLVRSDIFLAMSLALLGLYLLFPFSSGFYAWLNDRLLLIASMLLFVCGDGCGDLFESNKYPLLQRLSTKLGVACATGICALVLVNILVISFKIHQANKVLNEFAAATSSVSPRSVVLPLVFGDKTDRLQRSEFLIHASSYVTLRNGGINLDNYETQFDYFPVTFKPGLAFGAIYDPNWITIVESEPSLLNLCSYAGYIDYLTVWNEPGPGISGQITRCYSLVNQQGRQKIFIPKAHDRQ